MTGRIEFDVKIVVPPEKVPYDEELQLAGPFMLRDALLTTPAVQAQLDDVSRRAQGEPADTGHGRKEKAGCLSTSGLGIHPAVTYSPTQLPAQYHRR